MKKLTYKSTIFACYGGNFVMSIVLSFLAIIFIPLKEEFGLSFVHFGALMLINFVTQITMDFAFSKAVDKYGFRIFIVLAHVLCVVGLILFALAPLIFGKNVFWGFVLATIIFSAAGGFLELLLSPIVDAIPTMEKSKAMAMLHSFYCWGQIVAISVTTLLVFAKVNWRYIVAGWAIVPLIVGIIFVFVPLANKEVDGEKMKISGLFKNKIFILGFFAIICAGLSEATIAQWMSSYMEKGLGVSKIVGDMVGVCGFGLCMAIGRTLYGFLGDRLNINKVMTYGSISAILCYLVAALSPLPWLSITACVLSGFSVSLLWPGTLVAVSAALPLAGASMFALLSAGGDIGSALGSFFTGLIADSSIAANISLAGLSIEQTALRIAILCACIYPILSTIFQALLSKNSLKKLKEFE